MHHDGQNPTRSPYDGGNMLINRLRRYFFFHETIDSYRVSLFFHDRNLQQTDHASLHFTFVPPFMR